MYHRVTVSYPNGEPGSRAMYLVPTYLAESGIHGIGVFAATALPADTLIWAFDPRVDWRMTPEELAAFPEPYQSRLRAWCYLEAEGTYVLCGDNAKFMNHADAPNCDDPEGKYTVTNRAVEPGEELTCDYRTFDHESAAKGLDFSLNGGPYSVTGSATDSKSAS